MEPNKPVTHQPHPQPNNVGGAPTQPQTQHTANISHTPKSSQNNGLKISHDGNWPSQVRGALSFVAFIGGIFLAAFLMNQFVFQSYFVDGTSMVPTLQNNDRLIIEKVGKTIDSIEGKPYIPNRGDIVVLDSSLITAGGSAEQLIKRVIGLPGDTIHISDGKVIVTNQQEPNGFDVDKRLGLQVEPTYSTGDQEYTVPDGHVFVMGDNRTQNGSHDSRAFGPVAAKDLEGKLWARILPVNKAQLFPTPEVKN